MATGICHTDATRSTVSTAKASSSILGHEGAGVVREVGAGVTSVTPGDHVIPLYTPNAGSEIVSFGQDHLCTAIRRTGQGPDARRTTRFSYKGEAIFHYMDVDLSNFTVCRDRSCQVRKDARSRPAAISAAALRPALARSEDCQGRARRERRGVRAGGIGLNVIQGARLVGAGRIVGVDINPDREDGPKFGMTDFLNSKGMSREDIVARIVELTDGGADLRLMRPAIPRSCERRSMLPPRLGFIDHHRRRRSRQGNRDAPVPARNWPQLARHRLRRRQGPHRRAEDRRSVDGREDRHRPDDHSHA